MSLGIETLFPELQPGGNKTRKFPLPFGKQGVFVMLDDWSNLQGRQRSFTNRNIIRGVFNGGNKMLKLVVKLTISSPIHCCKRPLLRDDLVSRAE